MKIETIRALTDEELGQVIHLAENELNDRAAERRHKAMEQIRQIAAEAQIQITFANGRGRRESKPLKAGARYVHPTDPAKAYVVGKGRPPAWFEELRAKGRLTERGGEART